MRLFAQHTRGQSTLELALLLPIFVFLMVVFVEVYHTNMTISNESTETHIDKLEKFDHGNGVVFDPIYGGEVDAGQYTEFVPGAELLEFGENFEDAAMQALADIAGNRLLDFIFSKIPFFDESHIIPDFIEGFSNSALNSYIQSGFTEVDWEGATWDGATSALLSDDSTDFFQGANAEGMNLREFIGSGLQSSATSFTSSRGDEKALATGFVNGLMSSDSYGEWMSEQSNVGEVFASAAGGAISSTVAGAVNGNINFQDVARSAALGGLHTEAMADIVTSDGFTGDPRGSMTYGAFNSSVSTLISGGNIGEAAFAGASGAFYSQQIQSGFGDQNFLRSTSSIAFDAGISLAQGNSLETVGQGALASGIGYITGQGTNWAHSEISQGVQNLTSEQDLANYPNGVSDDDIAGDAGLDQNQEQQEQATEDMIINSTLTLQELGYYG